MPIYEYECVSCHHAFDVLQKVSDEPIKLCPACSQDTAVRLVSAPGFQLKGSGWYATDFKDKAKSDQKKTQSTSSSEAVTSEKTTTTESSGERTKD